MTKKIFHFNATVNRDKQRTSREEKKEQLTHENFPLTMKRTKKSHTQSLIWQNAYCIHSAFNVSVYVWCVECFDASKMYTAFLNCFAASRTHKITHINFSRVHIYTTCTRERGKCVCSVSVHNT